MIEQVYVNSSASEWRDIVISFYGSHFLLLKENSSIPLKELIQTKAKALDGIQGKIEALASKLIDKGLIRHSVV